MSRASAVALCPLFPPAAAAALARRPAQQPARSRAAARPLATRRQACHRVARAHDVDFAPPGGG
eukprot:572892-Prymnesium_polylepis.1